MSPGFALLRAPQLVQTQILNICRPQEILILSMCSKRAYTVAKVHRKRPEEGKLNTVFCGGLSMLLIKYEKTSPCHHSSCKNNHAPANNLIGYFDVSKMPNHTEMVKIGAITVPGAFDNGFLKTYWQDPIKGMKIVTDYVTCLFNMSIHEMTFDKLSLWMIDWINSCQEALGKATFYRWNHKLTNEELHHIFTNCKATDQFSIQSGTRDGFRYTGAFQNHNVFKSNQSSWVTMENLKSMDSIEIYLDASNFTCLGINFFLKHWLAGGSPRLSYANIELRRIIFADIFQDLTDDIVEVTEARQFKLLDGTVEHFSRAYDIQRKDGVKASVAFKQHDYLCIFVWPPVE